ncbi:isoleucine--tRNA ligase [Thiospirillum jenense]|uniref:Isoleucine--tRNA ligase n=1 Tax=Thiospirillum jenense TaxID=1653858 RepID=A0A839HCH3_9GAMM|nr:isoleucine--tRNA ligase [Thiospirillum jenense]MBB1126361.1 isoleucine--tRNA ligase [Thiospirillum jenense]
MYKHTLNLPQTAFAMKANLPQREPQILERWQTLNLYSHIRAARHGAPQFILHDGPPYANGAIHLGHAVNKILKDVIVKAHTLDGEDAPYVPGWDCHGLPIELQVEKKHGKPGGKISPTQFRQACRAYATTQIASQSADFQRLGVVGDWAKPYLTMDFACEADIVRALGRILQQQHIHQGFKPVHWCIDCGSALAEAEVEYADKESIAIDVRFPVLSEEALFARCHAAPDGHGDGPLSVVIWTTTPWTLPANHAVALNPEFDYAIVQADGDHGHERLLIAEGLLKTALDRWSITNYRVIAYGRGASFAGLKLQHPFYDREVPLILGEYVTLEAGTGAVHIAPGHGLDDYLVGNRYGLPVDNPVGGDGRFIPGTPLFAGEHVFTVNERVVEVLKAHGRLLLASRFRHSYPHCWRHKTPIIFRATPQWFISMEQAGLRRDALAAIEQVAWLPDWGQSRIDGMIRHRPDWCISRQRTWGVPIALLVHKDSGALHPRTDELLEQVAQRIELQGIDAWFNLQPSDLLPADEAAHYVKVQDTLDVWFDSGVTHASVLARRAELTSPADLYLEGSDQHRGWFQSSLLTAVAMHGRAPYRQVLTHGFTVDQHGRKMSKSLGNVISPQDVTKTLGADVLRLWVAATDYRAEMNVSDEILKRTADAYRRIRNTARFLLANLHDFNPAEHQLPIDQLLALDRWVLDRAHQLQADIIAAYREYQFHVIYHKLHNFCVVDLGSFYLDVIKDRQYTMPANSAARRSCQTVIYHIIEAMSRWLAPILSFTADEIWQYIPGERSPSVFTATWYSDLAALDDNTLFNHEFWSQVLALRTAVGKQLEQARGQNFIGAALAAELELYCAPALLVQLQQLEDELRFILIVSAVRLHPFIDAPATAAATELDELRVVVNASSAPKCVRCWHQRPDVGNDPQHPQLCGRCIENVVGNGETRRFA